MKVLQIGAAGGVSHRLARLLVARGDAVTGMHRDPAQAETVRASGATPLTADLVDDSVDELATKIGGHDAVVFSAGGHGTGRDKTTVIDGKGLEKAAAGAARAGVSRFVLVSVFPDALRAGEPDEGFEHYVKVKKTADVAAFIDAALHAPALSRAIVELTGGETSVTEAVARLVSS
jgi:nucleoside-diphosphate-sugar epimerase